MDTATPAATPAASAPASTELEVPRGAGYDTWRMSGKLPSSADDSATSDETPAGDTGKETPASDGSGPSTETPAASAADSATAQPQKRGKTKEDTARRFEQILTENKTLKQRLEALERSVTPPAPAASDKPTSQPAAAAKPEPKIDDVDAQGQPKYKTLADYLAAVRQWDKDQLLTEVETRSTKQQQERARQEQLRIVNEGWNARVEKARTKYADFDDVALNPDLPIKEGSVADAFVLDSEHGAEVLYYLGQNPDVLATLAKLNPMRQAKALFEIEAKFAKASSAGTPAKTVTSAPRPPHEVGGKGTQSPDEVEHAVKEDDQAAYAAAANRRDIARRKGK